VQLSYFKAPLEDVADQVIEANNFHELLLRVSDLVTRSIVAQILVILNGRPLFQFLDLFNPLTGLQGLSFLNIIILSPGHSLFPDQFLQLCLHIFWLEFEVPTKL